MRSRILFVIGVGTLALVVPTTTAPVASAQPARATCYAQLDNDNGTAALSQNFEPSWDGLDSAAADDFILRKPCQVGKIGVDGTYDGTGPADSYNVTFYRWKAGLVKRPIAACPAAAYTSTGSLFEVSCTANLHRGHFWVSVQANLDSAGRWGILSNNTTRHSAAQWENPQGQLVPACTSWQPMQPCVGDGVGTDLSFELIKAAS